MSQHVTLGGLPTIRATRKELAEIMVSDCLAARDTTTLPKLIFSSNGQGLALTRESEDFRRTMLAADVVHADGMSVVIASRWLTKTPLPERIPTTDFFHDAARAGSRHNLRFFMLGADENTNRDAFDKARTLYPDVQWVGRLNGYSGLDDAQICDRIMETRPDVVWIALGKPGQEDFCVRNRERLRGVGWLKTCGGLFDFLAERRVRAPEWMQQAGLEWLFRTLQEPRRLGWRYLTTNVAATIVLVRQSSS